MEWQLLPNRLHIASMTIDSFDRWPHTYLLTSPMRSTLLWLSMWLIGMPLGGFGAHRSGRGGCRFGFPSEMSRESRLKDFDLFLKNSWPI